MAKKKVAVLHAQSPFVRGGADYHVENLVKNLIRRGFETELVTIPFKGYPPEVLLDNYLMWRMVDLTEANGEKIDLVIPLKTPTYVIKHPNKVLWLMHQHRTVYDLRDNASVGGFNTVPGGEKIIKMITHIDNMTIKESKVIFSNSKNTAARLKKYNSIDATPLYHPPALAGQYKAGEFGDYVLSVGRLDRLKRTALLVRALPYCDSRIRVKIAGVGPEFEPIKKLARELGVQDRVDMLGFVPDKDIINIYANALAVCYPPVDEDYGYITLEAFLSKKPLLTCWDSGGVLEFAKQDENAFIVDPDGEQMGECFNRLYRNKNLARDLGQAGYERVKDISWDHAIDELTKTIR